LTPITAKVAKNYRNIVIAENSYHNIDPSFHQFISLELRPK
jgi:hypothetical protein